MLALDLAWLTGTAFLARSPSDPIPDWPPEPDRVFSALVASWGAGGEDAAERAALEWVEAQAPPELVGVDGHLRQTVSVYVPPNDVWRDLPRGEGADPPWLKKWRRGEELKEPEKQKLRRALSVALPALRPRNERTFPAVALDPAAEAHQTLVWDADPPPEHFAALQALAQRTTCIGHSASLVRARFRRIDTRPDGLRPARRAPYPGRLRELEALHARHLSGDPLARPRPATRSAAATAPPEAPRPFAAPADWVVLEHAGGTRPDLRALAVWAETMRKALMEGWTRAHREQAPEWISGHEADGTPTRETHLAVVPMANLGWEHADGQLMGLALVPPWAVAADWARPGPDAFARRQAFRFAMEVLFEGDPPVLSLAPQDLPPWRLQRSAGGRASLDPARYGRLAAVWASATPVLLDRHLKGKGLPEREEEAGAILRDALRRLGLPEPLGLTLHKHAAIRGAPSARPACGNPPWARWARRPAFGARPLVHARIAFAEPVRGPIVVGAGRFHGLGLFLPIGASKP